ncbi:rhodanese-like domain-containing protein [uncultured Enterovirga sp.]|uniref:rhodanese-like domain-containing protein n=1 Tax=uncultured Enterovirga sp. TaxID=2026352 RepID=UPI0035CC3ADF
MIAAGDLADRLASRPRRFALLDVREAGEAEDGHIAGATSLPRRRIEFRIDELISGKATPLVLYDGQDGRAAFAAITLGRLGYSDVTILEGGIPAWLRAGYRLETGVNVPSKRFGELVLEEDHVESVSPDDLADLRRSGVPFVQWDVRTPAEYGRSTLPGSMSVPGLEIVRHAAEAASRAVPVIVHCAGRTRSIIAARTLRLLGVTRAAALENGTMGWRLSGRSLAPGRDCVLAGAGSNERAFALAREAGVGRREPIDVEAALEERGRRNTVVVDVRSVERFVEAHVPGSVSRPGGQLLQCTDEVIAVEDAAVILVDDDDGQAAVAGYWLRRMGYPDVTLAAGGVPGWERAGLPLAGGSDGTRPGFADDLRSELSSVSPKVLATFRALLLDVGTSRDYRAGHIPGAAWLPRGWLELKAKDVLPPGSAIVVTDMDEDQAILGAAALRDLGYDAVWLEGGNTGWTLGTGRTFEKAALLPVDLPPDVVDPPYAKGESGMRDYLAWEIALTRQD